MTLLGNEKLLDLIYDAAAESELWSQVLTEIADLTRSVGGILFGQSVTASKVYFDFNGRLSQECNRAYQDRHMKNAWSESMEKRPVGKLFLSDDIVDFSTLRSTMFHDEVLRPQNIAHNGMVALAAREDFRAAFNICRTTRQGPFRRDEYGLLEQLIPHLRRSVLLGFRLDTYQALQRSAFNALSNCPMASSFSTEMLKSFLPTRRLGGAVREVVGIGRSAFSRDMKVSFQAARSIG